MIIHYLNVMRLAVTPDEANSPPIVYPNAMLTSSVALERLKAVARRNAKLLQLPDGVKVQQLTPARALDGPKRRHGLVLEQRLRVAASKRSNQDPFYDGPGIPSNVMPSQRGTQAASPFAETPADPARSQLQPASPQVRFGQTLDP